MTFLAVFGHENENLWEHHWGTAADSSDILEPKKEKKARKQETYHINSRTFEIASSFFSIRCK